MLIARHSPELTSVLSCVLHLAAGQMPDGYRSELIGRKKLKTVQGPAGLSECHCKGNGSNCPVRRAVICN